MRCRRTGKVMHRSEGAAFVARRSVKLPCLNVYYCSDCHHWHLGNESRAAGDFDRQAMFDRLLGKGAGA